GVVPAGEARVLGQDVGERKRAAGVDVGAVLVCLGLGPPRPLGGVAARAPLVGHGGVADPPVAPAVLDLFADAVEGGVELVGREIVLRLVPPDEPDPALSAPTGAHPGAQVAEVLVPLAALG